MRVVYYIEEWGPIPGFEGSYEASNTGKVRSCDRVDIAGRVLKGRELKQALTSGNKRKVTLYKDRRAHQAHVHWLVLETFVGPRPPGGMGLHWDDDPANNSLSNLRWGSRSENSHDSVRNGVHPQSGTTHCPRGHELAPWNNKKTAATKGRRSCLACSRAYGSLYSAGEKNPNDSSGFQALADRAYQELHDLNK